MGEGKEALTPTGGGGGGGGGKGGWGRGQGCFHIDPDRSSVRDGLGGGSAWGPEGPLGGFC